MRVGVRGKCDLHTAFHQLRRQAEDRVVALLVTRRGIDWTYDDRHFVRGELVKNVFCALHVIEDHFEVELARDVHCREHFIRLMCSEHHRLTALQIRN